MPFSWEVPFLVVVVIGAILYFMGRKPHEANRHSAAPLTGADLIEQIQETLGIAIMVESVEPAEPGTADAPGISVAPVARAEPGEPTTIRAMLTSGRHTTQVAVTADSEAKAWDALARAAAAWRNADFQHIQMWPGAGG